MSARQLRKLLNKNQSSESEQEKQQILIKENKFGMFQVSDQQVSESQLQEQESKERISKITKPVKVKEQEKLEDLLNDLKQIQLETKESARKQSILKRQVKRLDPLHQRNRQGSRNPRAHRVSYKFCLTPDKADWKTQIKYGIQMEKQQDPENPVFYFEQSKRYSKLNSTYKKALKQQDLTKFLYKYPFHIQALFKGVLGNFYHKKYKHARDFNERLLYAFQRAFHPQFSPLGQSILMQMQQNKLNKIFFRSLLIQIELLSQSKYYKTALELSKFLLSLSPIQDPLGALFLIDHFSIKSGKFTYFEDFIADFFEQIYGHGSVVCLPHVIYSLAVCRALANDDFSTENIHCVENLQQLRFSSPSTLLVCGMNLYPCIGQAIRAKMRENPLDIRPDPSVYGNLDTVARIYAERNWEIWKESKIQEWFYKCEDIRVTFTADLTDYGFAGFYDKYRDLPHQKFDPAAVQYLSLEGPQEEGNLDRNSHPLFLFFALLLPWNSLTF